MSIPQVKSLDQLEQELSEKNNQTTDNTESVPIVDAELQEAANELDSIITTAIEVKKEEKSVFDEEVDTRTPIEKLLASVNINVSEIKFKRSDDPIEVFEEIEKRSMFNATYEIVALQSAYRASFRAMNLNTRIAARKISGTNYEQTLKLLKLIYEHLDTTTLGKVSFESWLQITAEDDINTIIFGIYGATYPKESEYAIGCPHCGSRNDIKISKERLIQVIDPKAYQLVSEIIGRNLPPKELIKNSCVNHIKRIILPESKDIIDLCTPTLDSMLKSLNKSIGNKAIEPEIYGILKYIDKMAIISHKALEHGKVEYIEVSSEDQQISRINKLSDADKKVLEKNIEEKLKDYEVKYRIPDMKCSKCTKDIKEVEIAMTEVLFTKLAQA